MSKLETWLEKVDKDTSLDGTFYWQAIAVIEKLKEALERSCGNGPPFRKKDCICYSCQSLQIDPENL